VLSQALIFLIDTAFTLFTVALLLRFYIQWARAGYRNPLSEFLAALTDFMVRPARRVIPGLWGLDLATLVLAWLIQLVELLIVNSLGAFQLAQHAGLAFAALLMMIAAVKVVKLMLYIVMMTVIVQAVLTWINPYSPVMPLLNSLARPFLRPFQRLIPPIGNVDLSPLFVVIACQLLLMLPVAYVEAAVKPF
jgi:YggT family protein